MSRPPTLPQPHEDVRGVDRTDSLLSLDDANLVTRDLLRGFSRHLSNATLVGHPAPVVERMGVRLRDPQPGDLVVETSTIGLSGDNDRAIKGLGILLAKRDEWWHTDEEWAQRLADGDWGPADQRPADRAWYVQYGSAAVDVCRWTNCSFTAVPWPDEQFALPAGIREGTATVFTRDSLLGSLADSGFHLNLDRND